MTVCELQRWLSGSEHLLLFPRTKFWLPAPHNWQLTTTSNSSSRESYILLAPVGTSTHAHVLTHTHTRLQI